MTTRVARFAAVLQALLLMATLLLPALVNAAVWTDKADYAPGSVVTISGDNSDGAGYVAGETVHVDVTGPNGWTSSCDALADDAGAWSCQITLDADPDIAVGDYAYVATGLTSGASETGTFSDGANVTIANLSFAWHRTGDVAGGFNVPISGKYSCNNSGTNCTSITGISLTVTGVAGSATVTGLSTGTTNADWSGILQFRTVPAAGQFAIPADGKYEVVATLKTNLADQTANRTAYFGVDNTPPQSAATCNNASCAGPYGADVTVRLTATDPNGANGSGFGSGLYCTDTTNTCAPNIAYPNSSGFNLARVSGATYYVRFAATDVVGNTESAQSVTVPFTTDDPAPFVSSTSPSNGATAAADANIVITFSENVTVTTSPSWISVTCNGSPVAGTTTGSGTSIVTFDPSANIPSGANCSVQIQKNQVTDGGGNNMAANASFSFSVDAAPSVTSSTPSNGATGIPLTGSSITFNFSEPVNVDFITVACTISGNHTFSRTNNGTSAVTFTLATLESYSSGETCLVTLNLNTVHDVDAIDPPEGLASNYSFSFSVLNSAVSTTTSATNESATFGDASVTLHATVSPASGPAVSTGTVTFTVNGVPVTSGTVSGGAASATLSLSAFGAGQYTIAAVYNAGSGFLGSNNGGQSPAPKLTIGQASSTVTIDCSAGAPYTYTGSAQTPCTAKASGVGMTDVSLTGSLLYSDNTNAGTAGASVSWAGDANHTGNNASTTFSIGQRTLQVTASSPAAGHYGDAVPAVTPSYIGFVLSEDETDLTTAPTCSTAYTQGSVPGDYATNCSGGVSGNYAFSYVAGSFHVDKAPLQVTADDKTKTLNSANPALTKTYGGFVLGEGPANLTTQPTCTTTALTNSPVGSYPITCSGGVSGNYAFSYVAGTLYVQYASGGTCLGSPGHAILQPVNADGSSVVKQGSTVPVKFRVCDANGVSIGTPGVVSQFILVAKVKDATNEPITETIDSTTPDIAFRWSATDQQWIFNLNTKNLTKDYMYYYRIVLNDGSSIYFNFKTK